MIRALSLLKIVFGSMAAVSVAAAASFPLGEPPAKDQPLAENEVNLAKARAHYLLARQLEADGQVKKALEHYYAYLRLGDGQVFMQLLPHIASLASMHEGLDRAIQVLEEAMQRQSGHLQPVVILTQLMLQKLQSDDTPKLRESLVKLLQDGLKRFPDQPEAYHNAVLGYLALQMREEAESLLQNSLDSPVQEAKFWLQLGRTAQELWPIVDNERRQEHLDKINDYFARATELALKNGDEESSLQAIDYYLFTSQMKESIAACEAVVRQTGSLEARRRLWRLYDAMDRKAESLQALQDLVEAYPQDIEHQRLLAMQYRNSRQWKKAADHLEAALQTGGGKLEDYLVISNLLMLGDDEEKLDRFTARGQQLFPDNPSMGFLRARALSRLRRYDDAVKIFQRVAKDAATFSPDLLDDGFYFSWGSALERSGHFEEAARQFDKSIQLTPPDQLERAAQTMNYLGYMWLQQGSNLDKAEQLITKANELIQNEPAYIDSLGWLYYKQGKFDKALKELLRAEQLMQDLSPDDAEIFEHIAQTFEKLNQQGKAREYWRKVMDLNPTDDEIRQRAQKALGLEKLTPKPADIDAEKN